MPRQPKKRTWRQARLHECGDASITMTRSTAALEYDYHWLLQQCSSQPVKMLFVKKPTPERTRQRMLPHQQKEILRLRFGEEALSVPHYELRAL